MTDFYDDNEDNHKDNTMLEIVQRDLLQLDNDTFSAPKRARLDVNYHITTANQQSHHHNRRKTPLVNRVV